MRPSLDGTGKVGDDVWLLAHNDVTGRPYLQPRPLGLGVLAGERQAHPVRDWLAYLARTAPADVAARLAAAGYLTRVGRWRGGRWVPVDRDSAFAPVLRIRAALDASRPPTAHAAALTALAGACALGFRVAEYAPNRPTRPAGQVTAQLGPVLGDLIAHTRAAVDSAVLAHRT